MDRSAQLYEESKLLTPGGVSSPVRAFSPNPLFISEGHGSRIKDADGNEYIDLCMAYGPLLTGHACPRVMDAARQQIDDGRHIKDAFLVRDVDAAPRETQSLRRALDVPRNGRREIVDEHVFVLSVRALAHEV